MFNRNECVDFVPTEPYSGFTKFEQCAKDFTAEWIQALSAKPRRWPLVDDINKEAARLGILAAEEFCRQLEEREKDESKGD